MSRLDRIFRSVAASTLVCALAFAAVAIPPAYGAEPVNIVTRIDAAKGLVTVKESATGRTTQVEVTDKALLKSLREGQAVTVDPDKPTNGIKVDTSWDLKDGKK